MHIRDFDKKRDLEALRICLIELQDFEREIDPRMPPGIDIVEPYLEQMLWRCKSSVGKVIVAEVDGMIAGFATVLTKVLSDDIDDGETEYGLVSDLLVREPQRRLGLGRKLLQAAEEFARSKNVQHLRIDVLAANEAAVTLYESLGFTRLYVELEKSLAET